MDDLVVKLILFGNSNTTQEKVVAKIYFKFSEGGGVIYTEGCNELYIYRKITEETDMSNVIKLVDAQVCTFHAFQELAPGWVKDAAPPHFIESLIIITERFDTAVPLCQYTFQCAEDIASIVCQLTCSLAQLERHQIQHNDLKLDNILIDTRPGDVAIAYRRGRHLKVKIKALIIDWGLGYLPEMPNESALNEYNFCGIFSNINPRYDIYKFLRHFNRRFPSDPQFNRFCNDAGIPARHDITILDEDDPKPEGAPGPPPWPSNAGSECCAARSADAWRSFRTASPRSSPPFGHVFAFLFRRAPVGRHGRAGRRIGGIPTQNAASYGRL